MTHSDGIEEVRQRFDDAEPIQPSAGVDAVDDGAPPAPPYDDQSQGDDPHHPIMLACEQPMNDFGNGQRFVIHFGEDIMFVPRVGWFNWTGKVWDKDQDGLVTRAKAQKIWALIEKEIDFIKPTKREAKVLAKQHILRGTLLDLEERPMDARGEDFDIEYGNVISQMKAIEGQLKSRDSIIGRRLTHAKNAGNNGPIGHMLTESTTALAVPFEDLDEHPLDVNTEAGLLRFHLDDARSSGGNKIATVKLLPHERDQNLTKMMPVDYDPKAKAPLFDEFLVRVQPDREMREFLKRWLGLSMSGLKSQKLAFFFGSGANGKSVLVDVMGRIMAGYSASLKIESLTGSNKRAGAEATPDLIPLLGARFVRTSEPDQGEKLQEGLIKQLTGGEPIPVRPNYGDQIDMDPVFKLTIGGNHKPRIEGADDGIWRRVMLVPFDIQIPESERDEHLGEKLWQERSGILNWLTEGLVEYLEGGLQPPASILNATNEYREESDPIGAFLTKSCVITGSHTDKLLSKELVEMFAYYMMENGLSTWRPSTFTRQLASKAQHWRHPETGFQIMKSKASLSQYTGLKLTDEFHRRWDAAPKDAQGKALKVADDMDHGPAPHPDDGIYPT